MILLIVSIYLFYGLNDLYFDIYYSRINNVWGRIIISFAVVLLSFKLLFFTYLLGLFWRYKPQESVINELLPHCSVIVPAYNESSFVWQTLISIANSNYPTEKLEMIAIDDGSIDDTWSWMEKAKDQLGNRLTILQQPQNLGKRQALYRGFNNASGKIFITIDSDSIVQKNTLRNLVSPFVRNKNCGAVAGNVKIFNRKKAFIPKMLNVSFAYSFEFVRAAQSVLECVLCTPGALAAYRKDAVMACLPNWINQRFFGKLTDIGEDRALTNMILKQGYSVLFQKNAKVFTNVPENYEGLHKMFTRWERSNVRENVMMSRFAFGKFRKSSTSGPRLLLINQWIKIVFAIPFILFMIVFIALNPLLYFTSKLIGILIFSSIPALYYALNHGRLESIWAFTYGIFYAFCLFWITPYAIATANKRGWLTRGLSKKTEIPAI
ncbi:MAG TPA: glycosyltransferase [Saprospiraceae bacterium]|nr:glycosyltransferase [Saprospiraceae bacterium]